MANPKPLPLDDLKAAYAAGTTLQTLGIQHGVAAATIRQRLLADGVVLRPRGPRAKDQQVAPAGA